MSNRYSIIDFETTGFAPNYGDRSIEVALILVQDGEIIDRYTSLMRSDVHVSKRITDLTGIDNTQLQSAPWCQDVIKDIMLMSKGSTLVAHNAAFDSRFWRKEVLLATGLEDNQEFLCTMKLAKRLLPGRASYKLSELGGEYGYDASDAHRALPDTEVTVKLFLDLINKAAVEYRNGKVQPPFLFELQKTPKTKLAKFKQNVIEKSSVGVEVVTQDVTTPHSSVIESSQGTDSGPLENAENLLATTPNNEKPQLPLSTGVEVPYVEPSRARAPKKKGNSAKSPRFANTRLSASEILRHIEDENVSLAGLETRYYGNGNPSSYRVQITHESLLRTRTVSSRHLNVLYSKIRQQVEKWAACLVEPHDSVSDSESKVSVPEAVATTGPAAHPLEKLLLHTLSINDAVDWDSLKSNRTFKFQENHSQLIEYASDGKPLRPNYQDFTETAPVRSDTQRPARQDYETEITLWQTLSFQKSKIIDNNRQRYQRALRDWEDADRAQAEEYNYLLRQWESEKNIVDKNNSYISIIFNDELEKWNDQKELFDDEVNSLNLNINSLEQRYLNHDGDAIEEYCELVLERSEYPEFWQREVMVNYQAENKCVVLDFKLPEIAELPNTEDSPAPGIDSSDEKINLYRSVITQILLRTLHELFEADVVNGIDQICLNGYLKKADNTASASPLKYIASVVVEKDRFNAIDLSVINPVICYAELGGRGDYNQEYTKTIEPYVLNTESSKLVAEESESTECPDSSVVQSVVKKQWVAENNAPTLVPRESPVSLPHPDTAIEDVRIGSDLDRFIVQLHALGQSSESHTTIGGTLRDILELEEYQVEQIPGVGELKVSQWRMLKAPCVRLVVHP